MRIAALYDIHGNLPALEAVLDDVRHAGVDGIVVGGDVLPGPMPREVVATLLEVDSPVRFIHGNGDRMVLETLRGTAQLDEKFRAPVEWTAGQLDAEHERLIASWPDTFDLRIPDVGTVLFCHATPRNDTEIFTRLTPDSVLLPVFTGVDADVVVCGHTHMQFDRQVGPTRVVNAGSVGMPFGAPGADWLLLGPGVELRHTAYDVDAAAARIAATAFPGAAQFAENNVRNVPAERVMLEAYERSALR